MSAMILWFVGFLALIHCVSFLARGVELSDKGLRLWRFGRSIDWKSIIGVTVEPQHFFSRFFCLPRTAHRLTIFVQRQDGRIMPQYVPSFFFADEDFEKLAIRICQTGLGYSTDSKDVLICEPESLPGLKKTYKILNAQRAILSLVILVGLVSFLGRKAAVHYLYGVGNQAFIAGSYASAKRSYDVVVSLDPAFAPAWHNLGGAELYLGHVNRATQCWQRAIALKPDMVEAKVSLSYICLQRRDFRGAKDLLDSALRFDPGNIGALINLADMNMRLGHTREAIKICHEVMTRDRHNPHACCLLAQGRIRLGKPQEALSLIKGSILRSGATDTFCRMVMAEAFIAQGKTLEAIDILKELSHGESPSPDVLLNIARAQMIRKDWNGASSTLDRAASLNHLNPWIWVFRSEIALARNDDRSAREMLHRALSLNNQDAGSLALEAKIALKLGNRSQAVELANKSLSIEPVTPQAISVLEAAAQDSSH